MAVTFQNSIAVFPVGTTVNVSFNVGSLSDRVLYFGVKPLAGSPTSASYAGQASTLLGNSSVLRLFRNTNPNANNNTLSVTNSAYSGIFINAASFNGADQTTPDGGIKTRASSGSTQSTNSLVAPVDGMIFASMGHFYTSGSAAAISGAGNTLASSLRSGGSGNGIAGGRRSTSGVISWTTSGAPSYNTVAVEINPVASSGISIVEETVNTNYTSLDPTIDLTGSISITEETVNSNYTSLDPTITLTGAISIIESTVNTDYTSLDPTITLSGVISIVEQTVNTNYTSLDPIINSETIISSTFTGILKASTFSGNLSEISEFSGTLKGSSYNGILNKTSGYNGYLKSSTFKGIL